MLREVRQAAACVKSIIHNMPAMSYTSTLFICDVVNTVCHIFLQLYVVSIFASGFSSAVTTVDMLMVREIVLCIL